MKRLITFVAIQVIALNLFAQTDTFDVFSYNAPAGWKADARSTILIYIMTNAKTRSWCSIALVKSKASIDGIDTDLTNEWNDLLVTPYKAENPTVTDAQETENGWKTKACSGNFVFNNGSCTAALQTFSGFSKCASAYVITNSGEYAREIDEFFRSLKLITPPETTTTVVETTTTPSPVSSFKFTTTNFDDGWVSTERADWVEVAKGNDKVLIHYPNKIVDAYNSVLKTSDLTAWNTLVAPRYDNISNFSWGTIQSWESISFMQADAEDKTTGRTVFIVLFKKHNSTGDGRWLEFVCNNKEAYDAAFTPYHRSEFDWEKNYQMQFRNKFAVAAQDLQGTWGSGSSGTLSYYYANTGGYAGATATSVADAFSFAGAGTYSSDHAGASGQVGAQKFSRVVYKGKFTANEWNITLTNRFKGATETYQCSFEAVRGGRILVMKDKNGLGYTLVKQ